MGIGYARSFGPDNLEPRPDRVVVGNAVSRGNPELEAVLERRIPYTSAAQLLREELLEGRHVVAVAGTHGKTTTTSLLAWILESAGLDPSFLVGGVAENFGTSFRLGRGEHFVVEADEYDTAYFDKGPKMWHYRPWTAVVTNVELDHADIYRDEEAYRFAFERFVNLVPRTGTLVVGWDTPGARAVSRGCFAPVQSVDLEGPEGHPPPPGPGRESSVADRVHPRWRATDVSYGPDGTSFRLLHDGDVMGTFQTPLTGAFNVRNCLAAVAAARAAGASWQGVREGLATFRSVRRRMEVRGEVGGVAVVDDFAHHPTSVRGTLEAARQRFPGRRVWAVFEPRSYTAQRSESQPGYRAALATADRVVLADLFRPERYDAETGLDPQGLAGELRELGVEAAHVPEVEEIVELVAREAEPGDVVLVMSNGGFQDIHRRLLDRLRARDAEES
jgi:UDP-N-acetylmuramate: L-alanyl-gamma-D-glutamyl-meso-diaminopimelate ligase